MTGFTFAVQAPSNIAFIKYWGKKESQIPMNPSVSLTLTHCKTINQFKVIPGNGTLNFTFHEESNSTAFSIKIQKLFALIKTEYPELNSFDFIVRSENTFPHSSGIASSASGMASFVYGIFHVLQQMKNVNRTLLNQKISYYSRLGSGSACRSIEGPFVQWGQMEGFKDSSNDFGVISENHPSLNNLCDSILIVSKNPKKISSSEGHRLMQQNPYSPIRYERAKNKAIDMLDFLKSGDFSKIGEMIEQEALELHALMLTGDKPYFLMEPNSLHLIQAIVEFRKNTLIPVYFTLDAGPNLHLLYPAQVKSEVLNWIDQLKPKNLFLDVIHDEAGLGASLL